MEIFLVGGAVRDRLLGVPVEERDWVVVGATPEEMESAGYVRLDAAFPVFRHPVSGEEYALARREVKEGRGHKGFRIECGPEVSLEQDLRRRDLTINAMAEASDARLVDPYRGRADLDAGILRHVSPAFVEDPLRVLRVARFAARFAHWGFRISHGTHALLLRMSRTGELAALSGERIWKETERALGERTPARFFEVLQRCGALTELFPELAPEPPHSPDSAHRGASSGSGPWSALQRAAVLGASVAVRFAVLATDRSDPRASEHAILRLCDRLGVQRAYRELALLLARSLNRWARLDPSDPARVLELLESVDALRRPERLADLLLGYEALGAGPPAERFDALRARMTAALEAALGARAEDLRAVGLEGGEIARELRARRVQAIASSARD
jgi:tRNA nucleotidyltransferase (CCA-adding enzyme)